MKKEENFLENFKQAIISTIKSISQQKDCEIKFGTPDKVGGKNINLPEIKRPKSKWNSIINAVEDAYNHEVHVTKMIHNLVDLATSEKDHSTFSMLQWFVTEQIEEENITNDVIKKLELINNDGTGLFLIDQELASRTNEE